MNNVGLLIEDFSNQLTALIESQALDQARAVVERALGVRRPGRPPKTAPLTLTAEPSKDTGKAAGKNTEKKTEKKTRKKMPKQFCPVPGCKNAAAPVFGMVCADHKNVAKSKIKKYREARKAQKLGIETPKAGKPKTAKRRAKKVARSAPVSSAKSPVAAAA
ncbi:MAG TPA: hypothetical protein VFG23_21505 [Polyangia bacterium]|nr:hypothetical protein [Polyangia bacterium]